MTNHEIKQVFTIMDKNKGTVLNKIPLLTIMSGWSIMIFIYHSSKNSILIKTG